MANSANYRLYQPLLDGRLVSVARQVPLEDRVSERLTFDLIVRLAPELAELPLVDRRWAFEEDGPLHPGDADRWARCAPIRSIAAPRATFDWRLVEDERLYQELRGLIFAEPSRDLFAVLDRASVERAIPIRPKQTIRRTQIANRSRVLWGAASAATLLASDWRHGSPTHPIEVRSAPSRLELVRSTVVRGIERVRGTRQTQ